MARIVVCGYMIRHPVAGNMLAFFQYVLGLARLGHDVAYVEESGWPYSAYDPTAREFFDHPTHGLEVVDRLVRDHGLSVPVIYVNRDTDRIDGAGADEMKDLLAGADLLLNLGGVCWLPEFHLCRRRALLDMDPLFTQVGKFGAALLPEFHVHFTYGTNIGRPGCTIPTAGVAWRPTVPPVVVDLWDTKEPAATDAPLTTIANWGAYGSVEHDGQVYGQKDEEFIRVLDLPRRVTRRLEVTLTGAREHDRQRLREAGWIVRDGAGAVGTELPAYRSYVTGSRGEFSVAKNAYVKTRSGWFSDRSACYLAAARPVIVQDTGFAEHLPDDLRGCGLLTFSTTDEAAEAMRRLDADYDAHRAAAAALAQRIFAHDVVLPRLIESSLS
jgi:hypothetical protein